MEQRSYDYNDRSKRNTIYSPYENYNRPGPIGHRRKVEPPYDDYAWWTAPGPFTGMGPRGFSRSDEEIKKTVCERLAANGLLDASHIEVDVNDCIVTVKGTVDSRNSKRIARDVVDTVFGVQDVRNELRIDR